MQRNLERNEMRAETHLALTTLRSSCERVQNMPEWYLAAGWVPKDGFPLKRRPPRRAALVIALPDTHLGDKVQIG